MSLLHHVHVNWQFTLGGKPVSEGNDHLSVADTSPATIKTAITVTLGRSYPGGTFEILAIKNIGINTTN